MSMWRYFMVWRQATAAWSGIEQAGDAKIASSRPADATHGDIQLERISRISIYNFHSPLDSGCIDLKSFCTWFCFRKQKTFITSQAQVIKTSKA